MSSHNEKDEKNDSGNSIDINIDKKWGNMSNFYDNLIKNHRRKNDRNILTQKTITSVPIRAFSTCNVIHDKNYNAPRIKTPSPIKLDKKIKKEDFVYKKRKGRKIATSKFNRDFKFVFGGNILEKIKRKDKD